MSEFFSLPPELRTLELNLRSCSPRLSAEEQNRLLYQCAFAAGEQRATQRVRRWQCVAAMLGLGVLATAWPQRSVDTVAQVAPPPPASTSTETTTKPSPPDELAVLRRPGQSLSLDAWQLPPDWSGQKWPQLAASDGSNESLSVGSIWRTKSF